MVTLKFAIMAHRGVYVIYTLMYVYRPTLESPYDLVYVNIMCNRDESTEQKLIKHSVSPHTYLITMVI